MRVKSIFKKFEEGLDLDISEENVYDEKNMYSDLTNLCLKAHPIEVISRFLHDYYENSNSSEIELYKRVEIPFKLVLDGIIKKEEFLKEFSLHLSKVFSICSDFPYLSGAIVKLFFQFSKANLLKYNDIEIDWTGGVDDNPEEIKDDIQYTLKEFVKGSYKILKENVKIFYFFY